MHFLTDLKAKQQLKIMIRRRIVLKTTTIRIVSEIDRIIDSVTIYLSSLHGYKCIVSNCFKKRKILTIFFQSYMHSNKIPYHVV